MLLSTRPSLAAAFLAAAAGHALAQCGGPDRLNALDPAVDAYLGSSIAVDGQFILAGANNRATPAGVGAGVMYGYMPVNGVWTQVSHFTPNDATPNGRFGGAVALGGQAQWAVVGAWGVSSGAGEGYFFQRNTVTNAWTQVANFLPGYGADARFGQNVAMNKAGTIAAIAAPYAPVTDLFGTNTSGRVLVYARTNNTWAYQFDLHQYDASIRHNNDFYGLDVSADNNVIVVGAAGGDTAAHTDCGYIHIWSRDQFNSWTATGEIYAPDPEDGANFGYAVSVSGGTLAVGAPYASSNGVQEAGKVYLYRSVNGVWTPDGVVALPNPVFLNAFGSHVAASGDSLIVGAGLGVGQVYQYRRVGPGQWARSATFTNPGPGDWEYGQTMAIDGSQVVVGDGSATTGANTWAGCAYRYNAPYWGNDACEGAANVGAGTYGGCTTNASPDGSSSCGEAVAPGNDVWFSYTAPATGSVTLSTQGSDFDTILSIHSGCPGTAANSIACNDDFAAPQRWSQVTLAVAQGATYLIRVAGYGGASGQFYLDIGMVTGCYANCDNSTSAPILNVNDFICFQSRFAANDPWANCDASTSAPILNVNDFICFQSRFAAGCP